MNRLYLGVMTLAVAVSVGARETAPGAQSVKAVAAANVAETQEKADASAAAAVQDAEVAIDAEEKIQAVFDEFLEKKQKQDPSVKAYGTPNARGHIYYCGMATVSSKSAADPDFLKKRQMAFARAFQQIRTDYVKYTFRGFLVTGEEGSFLHDADALKTQPKGDADALKRLGQKVLALSEAKVDEELQKAGVDPSKYGSLPAKRKLLSQTLVRAATVRSLGTSTGVCVVKTVEGKGTDGTYSIGVIAKYDPEAAVIADCMARKTRPSVLPKQGKALDVLLKGDLAQNFGTRLYYDETGMPALLSFGQWSSNAAPGMDRTARKLLEKAAFTQAEAQANIDMNNFIAGHMTYDELAKAGERYEMNVTYSDDGVPAGMNNESEIDDLVRWTARTDARDSLAGRRRVFAKTLKHPDTGALIAVVAVNWSFGNLDQLARDAELRKPRKDAPPAAATESKVKKPGTATVRQGDDYDF